MKLVRTVAIMAACLSVAVGASAQTPYVGASLFGDIVRSTHTETAGVGGGAGGEAIGFALRAGTRLGAVWGVELEFARPSSIEDDGQFGVMPLSFTFSQLSSFAPSTDFSLTSPDFSVISRQIPLRVLTTQRNTTLSATAWAEQQLSARVAMAYLGGITFVRSQHEYSVSYSPLLGASPTILPPFPSYASETLRYGVGALAGFEARLALTDRAQLVPGIRLHAIDNTWLVRPSVGINWNF